ncbi:amino acid ABC transporter permease [Malaciobacter marinus]|jgi:polar amino acid transport system permease protein|uniref:amino acid ABC transporter permease n=1 Tax=Malaciobacter marinus TaxID=505249 RepID=UPI0009A5E291|nr:amino acid ABC transporter permease [Malaciobacter marinus]SKB42520.1 amino acid ABC transporter membrane protein, PAAT family [Malaciobacter marinus]
MSKKQSLAQNKTLGHIIAFAFYLAVGYFLYSAASNMNYEWKWTSIPKYFVYEKTVNVTAPTGGVLMEEEGKYFLKNDDGKTFLNIDSSYILEYEVGSEIYEFDYVASKTVTKPGPVLIGLWTTLKISFFAAILTFFVGIITALMKLSSYVFLKDIATVYITLVRGTPLLVQIFLFYFIIANIFELDRFVAGVLSLGIFFGAYMAEILRGAIQSIDKGQLEAANSLGISHFQAMKHIIFPQALKRVLPTLVGEMIALVKDSSLVSVIAITDLTKVGREIVSNTFSPFETWIVIALVYLSITFSLSYLGYLLEKKYNAKGGMA